MLLRLYKDSFKYIEKCYIDSLMNGEAIGAARRGDHEIEDIAILQIDTKLNEDEVVMKAEILEMKAR